MSQQIDLKELERQVYRSNFQDGIWDMLLGLLMFQWVVEMLLIQFGWSELWLTISALVYGILLVAGLTIAKKYIVTPRLGLVKFGPTRQKKKLKVMLIFSVTLLLGVVFFIGYEMGFNLMFSNPSWIIPINLFTVVAVVAFSLAAYFLDFPRAYLYGWFFGLAVPLNAMLRIQFGINFPVFTILFSLIMIMIGATLFIRFLQRYPLPQQPII